MQVANNPGGAYNPLFIYGGAGLGKTHLIHAIGNTILAEIPEKIVRYVHAEDYYSDVVRAYQQKSFDTFKRHPTVRWMCCCSTTCSSSTARTARRKNSSSCSTP